jgi:Rad3-related DNA helicase
VNILPTNIINLPADYSKFNRDELKADYNDILKPFFPYGDGRERENFKEIVAIVRRELSNPLGAENIFIEVGTGLGKSGIVRTLGEWNLTIQQPCTDPSCDGIQEFHESSYFVLTSKLGLMDQYQNEPSKPDQKLKTLRGRSNFKCYASESICGRCTIPEVDRQCQSGRSGVCNADKAPCVESKRFRCDEKEEAKDFYDLRQEPHSGCEYLNQYYSAAMSPRVLTNPAYLFKVQSGDNSLFQSRTISFFDEAHNLPDVIRDIATKGIYEGDWKRIIENGSLPLGKSSEEWLLILPPTVSILSKKIELVKSQMKKEMDIAKDMSTPPMVFSAREALIELDRSLEKFTELNDRLNFIYGVLSATATIVKSCKTERGYDYVSFTPIFVAPVAKYILDKTSERRVFLSATFRDATHWVNALGIGKDNNLFIFCEDSPFPVKNRPIYYIPQGSMSYNSQAKTLPKMVEQIDKIMDDHKGQHGLILPFSYELSKKIVAGSRNKNRIIEHSRNKEDRDDAIERFLKNSPKDSVIISPSLGEGFNGYGDSVRFNVICKLPYPSIRDELIAARIFHDQNYYISNCQCRPELDETGFCNNYRCGQGCKRWYRLQAAIQIIQECGRGVRYSEDWCDTYILDTAFGRFYKGSIELFPKYFRDALIVK